MIVLSNRTYRKIDRAINYPSITGGQGVRATRQPGGNVTVSIPPTGDGGGLPVGGPPSPPYDPTFVPPSPSYDPYEPINPS